MFHNQHTELGALPKLVRNGSRAAHVLGISYSVAKSRNLIGSKVTFAEYNDRRIKAQQEEYKL